MTAAKTGGMRAIEAAIHHLVRSLLKATDHHEDYNLYTTEFNRLKSCGSEGGCWKSARWVE
jgi:hypothetical protein